MSTSFLRTDIFQDVGVYRRTYAVYEALKTQLPIELTPVIMPFPNRHNVYSPHPERLPKTVKFDEFAKKYALYKTDMLVCFAPAGTWQEIFAHSIRVEAVCYGLEGWYIITAMGR